MNQIETIMKLRVLLCLIFLSSLALGQIQTTNLEGEYRFTNGVLDDTAGENDLTQNGSNLTFSQNRAGGTDRAIDLNGDYLTRNGMADSPITISFWIKTTTNDSNKRVIIDQTERSSDSEGFTERGWYAYLKDGKVGVAANFLSHYWNNTAAGADKHSGYFDTEASNVLSDGTWHNVVFTARGEKISTWTPSGWTYKVRYTYGLYVDGTFVANNPVEVSVSTVGLYWRLVNPAIRMTVGNHRIGNSAVPYEDEIDDIRFYSAVLTGVDIAGLANETGCAGSTSVTAVSQDITVELDSDGNATITPDQVDNGSINTCGDSPELSLDITEFSCDDLGDNTVTLSVVDEDGNTDNTTAVVTVVPLITVSASSSMTTVYLDENGEVTVSPEDIDDGSTTCCGDEHITLSLDQTDFNCSNVGSNITLTLTASDIYGNSESTTALILPEDTISPTVVGQDVTVTLDENTGDASITTADVDNGSTDNCTLTLSLSKSSFGCEDIGENTVTLTGTDGRGNSASVDVTVTVNSIVNDEALSASTTAFCPDGSAGATISTASSVANVNYYLRNSEDNSIVDGPITGTGSALDFSTGNISETTTYNVFAEFSNSIPTNYGLDFDGVDDYISASVDASFDYTAGFSFESWVKSPLPGTTGGYLPMFFLGTSAVSDVEVYTQQTTNNLVVVFNRGSSGLGGYSFTPPPNNTWYHLAVTYDGTNVKVYYDGVEQSIVDASNPPGALLKSSGSGMSFGYVNASAFLSAWGSKNFLGQMDEIRVWSTVRTQTEISDNMSVCGDPDQSGIVAYFPLNEGSGSTTTDEVSGNNAVLQNMDANTDWIEPTITLTCEPETCGVQMTQEIIIGDSEAPSIVSQNLSVTLDENGEASIEAVDFDNGSTDNCTSSEDLQFSSSQISFDCSDVGVKDVTFSVTDLAGNTSDVTVEVTITDDQNPTLLATNLVLELDENGSVSANPEDADNGSTDNCSLSFELSQTDFDCSHIGDNTVTFTITDAGGNSSSQDIIVTIEDNLEPTLVSQDMTYSLDDTGSIIVDAGDLDNGSSDNCTIAADLEYTLSTNEFTCDHIGSNSVTLSVTDESGNSSSGTVNITIVDDTAPIVETQDIVVWLDENLSATITADDLDNGSSDNCNITSLTVDVSSFGEQNIGENTVTLTAIDASGNESSSNAIVTVKEMLSQSLSFTAMSDKTYGDVPFAPEASSDLELTVSYQLLSGPATFDEGFVRINGVGTIVIEALQNGNDTVYAAEPIQISVDVNAADLTVIADDISITYGDNIPTLTYTYSGFVNGEDSEAITETPSISTTAHSESNAGVYPITISGGSATNYVLSYADASLTINKASQTISLASIDNQDNTTTTVPISASTSSGLALSLSVTGPATIDGMNLILDGTLGTVTLTASQAGDDNYLAANDATITFEVIDPCVDFEIEVSTVTDATLGGDGEIDITLSGGNGTLAFDWSNGASTEDLSGLDPGQYTVVVTDEKGCSVTATIEIQDLILSAKDVGSLKVFNAYPNPVTDALTISNENGSWNNGQILIYDMSGRLVLNRLLQFDITSKVTIDVNHLKSGQYLMMISAEGISEKGILIRQP